MSEPISLLLAAMATFVGGHFILASLSVRTPLIRAIGENGFRALFSVAAIATLFWAVSAYNDAPYIEVWPYSAALTYVPLVVMPFACILFAAAVTSRNPTSVGGEKALRDPKPPAGILTVTRHPMLWSFLLWAVSHMAANGDQASLILFGGLALLSAGGMLHIDHRRQAAVGADWGPIALSTSVVPFAAAIQGRCKVDWAGIGLGRVALGLAIYAALALGHPWLAGVSLVGRF